MKNNFYNTKRYTLFTALFFSSLFSNCKTHENRTMMKTETSNNVTELNINNLVFNEEDHQNENSSDADSEEEKDNKDQNTCLLCTKEIPENQKGSTKCCKTIFHKDCMYSYILGFAEKKLKYLVCPNDECPRGYNKPINVEIWHSSNTNLIKEYSRDVSSFVSNEDIGLQKSSFFQRLKHFFQEKKCSDILFSNYPYDFTGHTIDQETKCINKLFRSLMSSPFSILWSGLLLTAELLFLEGTLLIGACAGNITYIAVASLNSFWDFHTNYKIFYNKEESELIKVFADRAHEWPNTIFTLRHGEADHLVNTVQDFLYNDGHPPHEALWLRQTQPEELNEEQIL